MKGLMIRNEKILNSTPMRALNSLDAEDTARRKIILLRILSKFCSLSSEYFGGAYDKTWIQANIGASESDAAILWDVCIMTGVLEKDEHGGYSPYSWLHRNQLICKGV